MCIPSIATMGEPEETTAQDLPLVDPESDVEEIELEVGLGDIGKAYLQ